MGGSLFGGGGSKVNTAAYDRMVKDAQERAKEAERQAKEAEDQQRLLQTEQAEGNKARRASAANRFSLLLFEDGDLENMLGS